MNRSLLLAMLLPGTLGAQEEIPAPKTDPPRSWAFQSGGIQLALPALPGLALPEEPKKPGLDLGPIGVWKSSDIWPFLGGALLGLGIHESGHLISGYAIGAHPSTQRVSGGGASFIAITYDRTMSPRERYGVSSAGFVFQYAASEWVLEKHPHLWTDDAPVSKGVFAFHIVTSLIYAYGAICDKGPTARDTLAMAQSLGIHEKWVGVAVLLPALLDVYRSIYPEAKWACYTSRSVKLGFVLALAK
jgi:hypothetical protein